MPCRYLRQPCRSPLCGALRVEPGDSNSGPPVDGDRGSRVRLGWRGAQGFRGGAALIARSGVMGRASSGGAGWICTAVAWVLRGKPGSGVRRVAIGLYGLGCLRSGRSVESLVSMAKVVGSMGGGRRGVGGRRRPGRASGGDGLFHGPVVGAAGGVADGDRRGLGRWKGAKPSPTAVESGNGRGGDAAGEGVGRAATLDGRGWRPYTRRDDGRRFAPDCRSPRPGGGVLVSAPRPAPAGATAPGGGSPPLGEPRWRPTSSCRKCGR